MNNGGPIETVLGPENILRAMLNKSVFHSNALDVNPCKTLVAQTL